jgi:hypothetical protein
LGAYVGGVTAPKWLTVTEVLSYFGNKGKRRYKEFIADGVRNGFKTPWEELRGQVVIGSEDFVKEVAERHLAGRGEKCGEVSRVREVVGVRPDKVLRDMENYFGIKSEEIRCRGQRYTDARYVASLLLRRYCLMSYGKSAIRWGCITALSVMQFVRSASDPPVLRQSH